MDSAVLIPRPDFAEVASTPQGQRIVPVLNGTTGGNVPGSPMSAGWVIMPPGWTSRRHRHDRTWVVVLVWTGGAITRWGPDFEHEIPQRPGELFVAPPGVPHVAENRSTTDWVVAFEIRSNVDIGLDNIPLDRTDDTTPSMAPANGHTLSAVDLALLGRAFDHDPGTQP